jgi:hypothetical protein
MSDNPKKEEETQLIGIEFNDFGNHNHHQMKMLIHLKMIQ